MELDYTFVIRTIGTAGEKYQQLLDSIARLTIKPREVIVVLPEGYSLPPEKLGWERFVYTPKGMIAQRALCLDEIKTEYAIFSDDDWTFEPSIVEKLARPITEGRADVTFPIFASFLPQGWLVRITMALIGTAVPMFFHKKYFSRIRSSGAYSYNPFISDSTQGEFVAESAPGLCFLIKTKDFVQLHFEDEMWLQDTGYAFPDDQVMFYKLHLRGKRIIGIAGLDFIHLDSGSSTPGRKQKFIYARSRNLRIFWHRFIYSRKRDFTGRLIALFSHLWMNFRCNILSVIKILLKKENKDILWISKKGRLDAKEFIKSETYKSLPNI